MLARNGRKNRPETDSFRAFALIPWWAAACLPVFEQRLPPARGRPPRAVLAPSHHRRARALASAAQWGWAGQHHRRGGQTPVTGVVGDSRVVTSLDIFSNADSDWYLLGHNRPSPETGRHPVRPASHCRHVASSAAVSPLRVSTQRPGQSMMTVEPIRRIWPTRV